MLMGQLVVSFQQLLPPITLNYIFTHLMWIISLGNITFIWLTCQWVSIVSIYIYYRIYTCKIYHNHVYVSIFRLFLFASNFFLCLLVLDGDFVIVWVCVLLWCVRRVGGGDGGGGEEDNEGGVVGGLWDCRVMLKCLYTISLFSCLFWESIVEFVYIWRWFSHF